MNYDFGFVQPFFGAQYGKHENVLAGSNADDYAYGDLDGYALHLGAIVPSSLGETQVSLFWADGDGDLYKSVGATPTKNDVSVWGIALFHNYELSNRTSLYVGMGYSDQETKPQGDDKVETKAYQCGLGLVHSF